MKPAWDAFVNQLQDTVNKWESIVGRIPENILVAAPPGFYLPKSAITKSLSMSLARLSDVNKQENIDPLLIFNHQQNIQTATTSLLQVIGAAANNTASLNAAACQNLVNSCASLQSTLSWFPSDAYETIKKIAGDSRLAGKNVRILELADKIESSHVNVVAAQEESLRIKDAVIKLLEDIRGHEREANTAKRNAQASAADSEADRKRLDENWARLEDGIRQQNDLLTKVALLHQEAERALMGASRVGLAKSFTDRRRSLVGIQIGWATAFIVSIAVLVWIEYWAASGKSNLYIVGHALLGLPIVWLAWFSVRQYGQTSRLTEDYAFKEAGALAYYGYRREMSEDDKMITLLREAAIRNFGSNPANALGRPDPGSPMHQLIEEIIEKFRKLPVDRLLKVLEAVVSRDK
ncbi:MAG: hypothetical protein M0Z85_00890 [Gammaproteobacteria bacterium]|jgi:hypothetical protein|nr:hypothetical protein [Gammaproteobacteria bacterium]